MKFDYYIPTRLLFGAGKLKELHKHKLPGKKALIVMTSGKSLRQNGYLAALENELSLADASALIYDKITANPEKTQVMEGAHIAKENGCDFVIGFGGGSSIDAAKAIAVMATNPGDYWDYISGGSGKGLPVPNDPLPIVAITTTAGTGTEADPWMVITKADTNEKIGFGYDKTFPALSVVDPELMLSVPPALTAYQGFDALFHSTEGYLNTIAYPVSDAFALRAIGLVSRSLPAAVRDGANLAARTDVALANTLSGMVESTSGCISEHSLAHAIGAMKPDRRARGGAHYDQPCVLRNLRKKRMFGCALYRYGTADGENGCGNPHGLCGRARRDAGRLRRGRAKMSDYGIRYEDLPKYVDNAFDTMGALFRFDPCALSKEDCLHIYQASYR